MKFFKHLFLSPSSATRDLATKPKKRSGQAKLNGMQEVTSGSIAYAFLMVSYSADILF